MLVVVMPEENMMNQSVLRPSQQVLRAAQKVPQQLSGQNMCEGSSVETNLNRKLVSDH